MWRNILCFLAVVVAVCAITGTVPRVPRSHCPLVLSYDAVEAGSTRYRADILLTTENTLRGFTLNISFDHAIDLLENEVGAVTTSNNRDFSINCTRRLKAGTPFAMHIFVRHRSDVTPAVASIKLDDRVVCEPEPVIYQLDPQRVVAVVGDAVTILGRAVVPLSLCRFQFPPFWRHVDLSLGAATPPTSEYEYHGDGLEAGECGIKLKYVREDMDGVVESAIMARDRDDEERAATTLRVTKLPRPQMPLFEIIPRRATLTPGDNLTLSCHTDHPINMCHIYLPGDRFLNFDLGAGSPQSNREHRYHGTGLKDGDCGVTLTRVDERLNGFIVCKVGMWPEQITGAWETDAMFVQTKYPAYQTEPRRALLRPGQRITLLGRVGVPLDICHFHFPPTHVLVDLSLGAATPSTAEYEYHGAGLEHGECGITFKRVHDGMDGLVESKVKAVERSVLENCATSLRVTSVSKERLPVFRIRPKRADLKPGANLTVTCNADRAIDMCTFYLPGPRKLNFDQGPNSVATGEYRYHGSGLSQGHCGVTLTRVTERLNGFVVCKVGMFPETTMGAWQTDSLQIRTSDEPIRLGAEDPEDEEEDEEVVQSTSTLSFLEVIRTVAPVYIPSTTTEYPERNKIRTGTTSISISNRNDIWTPTTRDVEERNNFRTSSTTENPNRNVIRTPSTTTRKPSKRAGDCGRVQVPTVPLITHAQGTYRGQWPWHAALYISTNMGNLQYMCGGSLIGPRAMITAAHCVTQGPFDRPASAATLKVFLGKYHLLQWSENGVQEMRIEEVIVHPGYNRTGFRNDIAILTFIARAEFTQYVRPVCLWDSRKTDINEVEDKDGTVVGWGYDEHGQLSQELMMGTMPVVSYTTCVYSNPAHYTQFSSSTTYCAGFRNGTSVCNGDSGGGMVFPTRLRNNTVTWHLRGLTSNSLPKKVGQVATHVCDPHSFVVFTDVAQFLDWATPYAEED